MTIQNEIKKLREDIESFKKATEVYNIYVVSVDENGNEDEPELLFSTTLGVIK